MVPAATQTTTATGESRLNNLSYAISVLSDIPKLNLDHESTSIFNPRLVAGVVADWMA